MPGDPNRAIVHQYWEECWNNGNLDALRLCFAPNFVQNGHAMGVEGFKKIITGTVASFPDFHVTIDDEIAVGDRIVTRATFRGTHQGPFVGVPPTGKRIDVMSMDMFRVDGGKIVEYWRVTDHLEVVRQLGASVTLGQESG